MKKKLHVNIKTFILRIFCIYYYLMSSEPDASYTRVNQHSDYRWKP